eukprot:12871527-Alexandrium_andersonii.AAC.1
MRRTLRVCGNVPSCSASLPCILRGPSTSVVGAPQAPAPPGASAPSARPPHLPHRALGLPRRSSRS